MSNILNISTLIADILAIFQTFISPVPLLDKLFWLMVILMLRLIGFVLWYILGLKPLHI